MPPAYIDLPMAGCHSNKKDDNPNVIKPTTATKSGRKVIPVKKITEKTVPGGMLIINGHYDEAQDETTSPYFYNPSCKTKWVRYALSSHVPMLEETERYVKDLGEFLIQ